MSLLLWVLIAFNPAQAVQLGRIQSGPGNQLALHGQFGPDCKHCEIIVDYGKGLLYAYRPVHWNEKKLRFTIKDLGTSLDVNVFVRTAQGDSNAKPYRIKPRLKPTRLPDKPALHKAGSSPFIVYASHSDSFGGKGVDAFDVSTRAPACNKTADIFHRAKLIIEKQRFGDARVEQKPPSGCTKCPAITVRWYHEPTGRIDFQLHIQRRQIQGVCSGNRRSR